MIVYKITNQVNGKIYIGQTIRTLKERRQQHIRDAFTCNSQCAIHYAMRKYGEGSFIFETLCSCVSKADMDQKEMEMIRKLNSKRPAGYNLTDGGEGCLGLRHTKESKAKLSAANKGRKMTAAEIERRKKSHAHTKMTEEHKARLIAISRARRITEEHKIKLSRMGTKHTPETRAKMSASRKGHKPYLGHTASAETRAKLSASLKGKLAGENNPMWGKHHSTETKVHMSIMRKGRKNSPESIEKQRLAVKGRRFTEKHKANLREAQLKRYRRTRNPEQIKERMAL